MPKKIEALEDEDDVDLFNEDCDDDDSDEDTEED
jgi:hypothetical protein